MLEKLTTRLSEKNSLNLTIEDNVKNTIVHEAFGSRYGVRTLKKSMETLLEIPLSNFIVKNQPTGNLTIRYLDNDISFIVNLI